MTFLWKKKVLKLCIFRYYHINLEDVILRYYYATIIFYIQTICRSFLARFPENFNLIVSEKKESFPY